MTAYYNEIDPYCAEWLRNLIFHGLIAEGDVDTRSIVDVQPDDLRGYTQCHFFAGIGVWSLALRNAGWRDDEQVWTGSCPCQPFSAAGKRGGTADERHLWPAWSWLICQCKPRVVFGEQVASKDGRNWLDLVQTDLEGMGFAVGAGDICAAGVGAPHIRQRLYFVADAERGTTKRHRLTLAGATRGMQEEVGPERLRLDARDGRYADELGNPHHQGPQGRRLRGAVGGRDSAGECAVGEAGAFDWIMADSDGREQSDGDLQRGGEPGLVAQDSGTDSGRNVGDSDRAGRETRQFQHGPTEARSKCADQSSIPFWSACDWLPCIDGKARPVEPGTFPLVNGAAARVGRLRAYGNAIVAPCAEAFIEAYMSIRP